MLCALLLAGIGSAEFVRDAAVFAAPSPAGFETSVSADGRVAMTAGYDGTFQFWNVTSNGRAEFVDALRRIRSEHANYALSGDGRCFAMTSAEGQVQVWDRKRLVRIHAIDFGREGTQKLWFHPFRPWLVAGSYQDVRRLDLPTGEVVRLGIGEPLQAVPGTDLVVSPYGIADGRTGKTVRLWQDKVANDEPVSVSPDGKLAVIAGEDPGWAPPEEASTESAYARQQSLRVWRLADGKLLRTLPGFWTFEDADRSIIWLNNRLILVPGLGTVRDAMTGRLVRRVPKEEAAYRLMPNQVPILVRGKTNDRRVRLRFPDPGARVSFFGFGPGQFAAFHDQKSVYRSPGMTIGTRSVLSVIGPKGRRSYPNARMSGGSMELAGNEATTHEMWGTQGSKGYALTELIGRPARGPGLTMRRTFFPTNGKPYSETVQLKNREEIVRHQVPGWRDELMSMSAHPAGSRLLFVDFFAPGIGVTALDRASGKRLWRFEEEGMRVLSTSVTASKDRVALFQEDGPGNRKEIVLLDATTGKVDNRLALRTVYTTVFSPDGQRLAVLGEPAGIVDVSQRSLRLVPLNGGSLPLTGNLNDALAYWTPSGRLVVGMSLLPISVFDGRTGARLAQARIYGNGTWAALRSDGTVDGSAPTDVRRWTGGGWQRSTKREAFFLQLLR